MMHLMIKLFIVELYTESIKYVVGFDHIPFIC